jgi:hypothetical protein
VLLGGFDIVIAASGLPPTPPPPPLTKVGVNGVAAAESEPFDIALGKNAAADIASC